MTGWAARTAVGITLIAASHTTAQADGKFYPGTMCHVEQASHTSRSALRYANTGMAVNNSTTDRLQVVCPIVRDSMASGGTVSTRVFIHASNNGAPAMACELREIETWGGGVIQLDRAVVPNFGGGIGPVCNTQIADEFADSQVVSCHLDLNLTGTRQWSGAFGSGYVLACALPPRDTVAPYTGRSGIGGYFVLEDS